jgi:hypothetical protein
MGIGWTWFFYISMPMGPNFIMRVLQNLGPLSFKLSHSMIGPLYTIPSFFIFDVVMKNL